MKKTTLTLFFLSTILVAFGQQKPSKAYFQQNVNYKIDVLLDDEAHILNGGIEFEYTNNSPDDLTEIYFHLWPNAYKNTETEFAKQQYEQGNTKFLYASEADRGRIDQLDFSANGQKLEWKYDETHVDIALVQLKTPLKSGETRTIKTPFRVKIPASFSRLGHVQTSYQMTQWYPKPAVYDKNGWHQMPYLNQGEFYSEYGSFDVSITLPKNYVVGATGTLQNQEEIKFLEERVAETNEAIKANKIEFKIDFPISSDEKKTLRYTADDIHDFAWFADKRFWVQKGEVQLASGKKVDTWAMFTHVEAKLWKKGIEYLNRSVKFYSDKIGEYPYPHATAVQSALSAGGGMEYPMITVIGRAGGAKSLDIVITHEVGHNWFYGILGSNERQHVWMDEGFNSFYEEAYTLKYYKTQNTLDGVTPKPLKKIFGADESKQDLGYAGYLYQKRKGEFIPPSSDSRNMTSINYGILGYIYPAFLFRYAEAYLGEAVFEKAMKTYFQTWKFKHPQPNDVKAIFEKETGKDFGWLFDDIFQSKKKLDYAVKALSTDGGKITLKISNEGEIPAPFSVSGLENGVITETVWYEGFTGTKEIEFPNAAAGYRIDAIGAMPETNRYNNYIKTKGLFKKAEKLQIKLLGGLETGERRKLFLTPTLGGNMHDGFMLGAAFYNSFIPQKALEFVVMPMYGFGSGKLVGTGDLNYTMFPKSDKFRHVKVGVNVKSFSKRDNDEQDYAERYLRIMPRAELKFKPSVTSTLSQYVRARGSLIQEEFALTDINGDFGEMNTQDRTFYELGYELANNRVKNPYSFKVNLINNNYQKFGSNQSDTRLTVEAKARFNYYKKKKKGVTVRAFAGQFLANSDTRFGRFPLAITGQGLTDYFYDDWFFGRGERSGFGIQQVDGSQGGFKTPLDAAFRIGKSNSTLATLNLTLDAPMKIPVSAYIDVAYFEDTRPLVNEFKTFATGGLKLSLLSDYIEIYFPLVGSDELMNAYGQDRNFFERISFTLRLRDANPFELLKNAF
ncbi:MAG: M1 family metallopeptidase [Saprospiraceae bacterium]